MSNDMKIQCKNAIDDLSKLKEKTYLSFEKIEFWLLKYSTLYTTVEKNYSCSHLEFKLPCMCWNRQIDCLFVDIYVELEKISLMYRKNLYYTEEILYYQTIKKDSLKLQKWLQKNLTENNIDLPYSSEENKYYDKEISLCNGKLNQKYIYFSLKVEGFNFKSSYDFEVIYNNLFFNQKILPIEYENWKKESGFVEFEE